MVRHSKAKRQNPSFLHKVRKDARAMERRRDLAGMYFLSISDVVYPKCHALQGLRLSLFQLRCIQGFKRIGYTVYIGVKIHMELLSPNTTKA